MLISLLSLGIWGSATMRFFLSPVAGIFWIFMFFAFTPRALGFGVGDGFALSCRRMILLSLAAMLIALIAQKKVGVFQTRVPHLLAPVLACLGIIYGCYIASSLIFSGSAFFVMSVFEEVMVLAVALLAAFAASSMPKGDRTLIVFGFVVPVIITFFITLYELQVQQYLINHLMGGNQTIKILAQRNNLDGQLFIRDGRFRVAAFLGGPLTMAEYMLYANLAFFYLFFRKYISLPVFAALVGLGWFCLFSTGSRGAQGVFLISLVLLLVAYFRVRAISQKFVFMSIVIGVLVFAVSAITYNAMIVEEVQFYYLIDRHERSLISRFLQYGAVLNVMLDSPFIGFGIYRHPFYDLDRGLPNGDNHHLGVLLRGGFISLLAFWYMMVHIFRSGMRFAFDRPEAGLQPLGYLVMVITLSFALMKVVLYHNYNHVFFYALVFYALIQMSRWEQSMSQVQQNARRAPRRRLRFRYTS